MKTSEREDAIALVAVAGGLVGLLVVSYVGEGLDVVLELARSPLVPVLAGVMLAAALALLAVRVPATRRALSQRVRVALVPADSSDPGEEAVARFAAGLAGARRHRDLLRRRARAVRISLEPDQDGRLRYVIELPADARPVLRAAAAGYGAVELRDLDPAADRPQAHVVRTELVLARASSEPLRAIGVSPDPLAAFARALDAIRPDEDARVAVDLLPLGPARRRHARRRMLRTVAAAQRRAEQRETVTNLLDGTGGSRRRRLGAELVARRSEQAALSNKLALPDPMFEIQVLVATAGPVRGRAVQLLDGLLAAFAAFAGENHFRASGLRLPGGVAFITGADAWWRRRRFDRRARSGLFAPARRRIITAREIAGLLKPPTVACDSPNVLRSGGVIPPAPRGLPTFDGQPGLLPLGRIDREQDGPRIVGVPVEGTFFSYTSGRSRYGKTETAIAQFVHLARSGHGCFFLDPHEDALHRITHYLDAADRRRVVRIDFAAEAERQIGWNLFAAGRRGQRQQVDAVVDSFASALRWDEINARALNLTTQAAQALTDLARQLPPELAPTIFQIPTLLGNDEWRAGVLSHVSAPSRQFFTERFPRLSREAITPVTNLIDRLRLSPQVAAVLGNPVSTYDVRAAMDAGLIVLACPGAGTTTRDRLIANFLVYDVLHAATTRAELAAEARRPFFVFFDEVQTYDGASSGNLAALLEQTAKYGLRGFLLNQNPERLTDATLNAVTTNRSHLMSTTLNAKGAAVIAREWAGQIEPEVLTRLPRFDFLASVTLDGAVTPPFLLHGIAADDLHARHDVGDGGSESAGAPVQETLSALETHDARILAQLRGPAPGARRGGARRPA